MTSNNYTRRRLLASAGGLLLSPLEAAPRPNIILILADDLGYAGIGCFGNRRLKTPHLDALAAAGVRFTDFHSSGAVCSPTRAGLMTGRYQQRCGITGVLTAAAHRDQGLPLSEITFPALLKKGGYATAIFGKWHLGYDPIFNPTRFGFDEFRGYVSGNVDYFSHIDQTGVPDWWRNTERITEEGYTTELITRHAVRFIEANRDRPFFVYLAHEAPHSPYQGPRDRPVRTAGSSGQAPWARRDALRAHDEMVEAMDQGIGEVLRALERLKLERNTFVFFFSDNGGVAEVESNGPLNGHKGTLWEGGHRVPAIARWPGRIPAGGVRHETAICLDLFPTILAVAGVAPPARPLDGVNLLPLLEAGKPLPERTLFWGHAAQRAVRQGKWKLLLERIGGPPRLFDLAADPGEKNDLAAKHPERVQSMLAALAAWEKEVAGGVPGRVR